MHCFFFRIGISILPQPSIACGWGMAGDLLTPRGQLGTEAQTFTVESMRVSRSRQKYGVDLQDLTPTSTSCNHVVKRAKSPPPSAYPSDPSVPLPTTFCIDMVDDGTAAARRQLKIKAGVVKRWVDTDQMIRFPWTESDLRFLRSIRVLFISFALLFFSLSKIYANLGIPPPHFDRGFFISRPSSCVHDACRLSKERKLYAQENQDQKLKVDKFIANNADEWDIKNGVCSFYPRTFHHPRPMCPRPKRRTSFRLVWNADLVTQKRMLEESERMITDTNKRLGIAVQELRDLVVGSTLPSSFFPPYPHFILPLPSLRHP